jgi:hypothetical protein
MSDVKPTGYQTLTNLENGERTGGKPIPTNGERLTEQRGEDGDSVPSSTFPKMYTNSDEPSNASKKPFRLPTNVKEFASQANLVATMILNNEIHIDQARAYSAVARTVAQAVNLEVQRSRFLRNEPNLEFNKED